MQIFLPETKAKEGMPSMRAIGKIGHRDLVYSVTAIAEQNEQFSAYIHSSESASESAEPIFIITMITIIDDEEQGGISSIEGNENGVIVTTKRGWNDGKTVASSGFLSFDLSDGYTYLIGYSIDFIGPRERHAVRYNIFVTCDGKHGS